MDAFTGIVGAIGTAVGAIGVQMVKTFGPHLLGRDRDARRLLVGRWKATWLIEGQSDKPETIEDSVEILDVRKGVVTGVGMAAKYGKYEIQGIESRFAVTLTYRGLDHGAAELVGVAILKLGGELRRVDGYWWQYARDGSMIGGKCIWEKSLAG